MHVCLCACVRARVRVSLQATHAPSHLRWSWRRHSGSTTAPGGLDSSSTVSGAHLYAPPVAPSSACTTSSSITRSPNTYMGCWICWRHNLHQLVSCILYDHNVICHHLHPYMTVMSLTSYTAYRLRPSLTMRWHPSHPLPHDHEVIHPLHPFIIMMSSITSARV